MCQYREVIHRHFKVCRIRKWIRNAVGVRPYPFKRRLHRVVKRSVHSRASMHVAAACCCVSFFFFLPLFNSVPL